MGDDMLPDEREVILDRLKSFDEEATLSVSDVAANLDIDLE